MANTVLAVVMATHTVVCLAADSRADANSYSDTKLLDTMLLQVVAANDANDSATESKSGINMKKACVSSVANPSWAECPGGHSGEITICDGETRIAQMAFYKCGSLTKVNFPDGLTEVGTGTFQGTALTQVTFPSTLTRISHYAFRDIPSLTQVTFPDGLESMSFWAFGECPSLMQVSFPDTLKEIGAKAFYDCTSLEQVTFGTGIEHIDFDAFTNTALTGYVYLPVADVTLGANAFPAGVAVKYLGEISTPGPTAPQATSASAFGDPHLKNIKKELFEVRQPGEHILLNVPLGATAKDVLLRVNASLDRVESGCSSLFIRRLDIIGQWLGSVPPLAFSVGAGLPGGADGVGLQVGNSSALAMEEFMTMVPSDMVKLTLPRKDIAAPSAVNKHATLMTATLKFGPGVNVKVSWAWERTPSAALARSIWVSVTGLSAVQETIGGLLGLDDHFHASKPEMICTREGESTLLRLPSEGVEVGASASLE